MPEVTKNAASKVNIERKKSKVSEIAKTGLEKSRSYFQKKP